MPGMNVRPIYESDRTREAEEATMNRFAAAFGLDWRKLPMKSVIDYAMTQGDRIKAWVECKRRFHDCGRYDTLMLSLHKWHTGRELARASGVPFYVAIEWNDGIYWINAALAKGCYAAFGGRVDRADPQDIEPCIFIPVTEFQTL